MKARRLESSWNAVPPVDAACDDPVAGQPRRAASNGIASDRLPRVLMAVHSAKPAGAQIVALGEAEALARDHDLIIAVGHGALRERFARLGRLVRAPTRVPIWGASRRRWALELTRALPDAVRLATIVRRRRVQVIVANSTVLVAPVLAARLARVPVVVCAHEAPKSRAVRRLFRFHGALADTVIAISPWIAASFAGSRSRVVISPPGIVLAEWQDPALHPERSKLALLVAGTIDRHKRQDIAIQALANLRESGVEAELQIVGREDDREFGRGLRQLASDLGVGNHVRFTGESSDVESQMRAADVVLVPAGEVTPLVLMESMAIGTPVVAARMGSIPDVVVDEESGLLVSPDDPAELADAIRRLIEEAGLAEKLAAGARQRVEEHFDSSRAHETLRAELRRLISR